MNMVFTFKETLTNRKIRFTNHIVKEVIETDKGYVLSSQLDKSITDSSSDSLIIVVEHISKFKDKKLKSLLRLLPELLTITYSEFGKEIMLRAGVGRLLTISYPGEYYNCLAFECNDIFINHTHFRSHIDTDKKSLCPVKNNTDEISKVSDIVNLNNIPIEIQIGPDI